jgi:hypothetical protein
MIQRMFVAAALLACGLKAQTTNIATRVSTFPPTGLAATETLQVNLVNTASNSTGGTAASCTGSVSFLNSTGAVIGTAKSFTLTSGQMTSISLPFASAGLTGSRGIVRAVLSLTRTSGVPCSLVTSLESFDTSSGATHLFLSQGEIGGFGPGR